MWHGILWKGEKVGGGPTALPCPKVKAEGLLVPWVERVKFWS